MGFNFSFAVIAGTLAKLPVSERPVLVLLGIGLILIGSILRRSVIERKERELSQVEL